jgi:outer membrane receptor protein involved in Fe transport
VHRSDWTLGDIPIHAATIALGEVEVAADRAPVEYQIDKKVVNVDQQLTAASGTAVDALQNVPSVTVELDGTVRLRGSGSFTVLIDGRPTVLDPSDALQQIPVGAIENIEIITNPSARYDPEGIAGIINVIMKKERRSGSGGMINVNAGLKDKYGADAMVTFTRPSWSAFFGADYSNRRTTSEQREQRSFLRSGDILYNASEGDGYRLRRSWGLRGGLNLPLGQRDNIGLNLRVGDRSHESAAELGYEEWIGNREDAIAQMIKTNSRRGGQFFSSDLDYRHSFSGNNGHTLSAQLSWMQRDAEEVSSDELLDPRGVVGSGRRTTEDGPMTRLQAKLDYILPLGDAGRFESGYQMNRHDWEDITSLADYDALQGEYRILPEFNRSTTYSGRIHALYAMYGGEYGSWGYQAGLRGERMDRTVEQIDGAGRHHVGLFDLFPSFHSTYTISPLQQLMASYTRRTVRPRGWYLEPFETWTDAFNVRRGNPALTPEYIDAYEAGYQTHLGASLLSFEAYHRVTHDKMEFVRSVYRDNITLRTVQNIGREFSTGAEIMLNIPAFSLWDVYLLGNLYNNRIEGELDGIGFARERFTWNMRFNNTFTLASGTLLQANLSYNSPSVSSQGRTEGYLVTNIALRQEFFGGRLHAILDISDVLRSAARESSAEGPDFTAYSYALQEAPIVMLTLRYNLSESGQERRRAGQRENDENGFEEM